MNESSSKSFKQWGHAWLAMVIALAIHVVDEVATDFLPLYNSIIVDLRESYGFVPFPTFTFRVWLAGLIAGSILLFALTPLVYSGRRALRYISIALAVVMILNGLAHIGASVYLGRLAPGVMSSPLLVVAAMALLVATVNAYRASKTSNQ